MAEQLIIPDVAGRADRYNALLPQLEALVGPEPDLTANLANIAAALREAFGFFWVGFYLVKADQLVLGPFQGPLACTRIGYGRGVCGTAWQQAETIVVDDVDSFPGHIACSSQSKSEIVVPIVAHGQVVGVIDVDSDRPADFGPADRTGLETIAKLLAKKFEAADISCETLKRKRP